MVLSDQPTLGNAAGCAVIPQRTQDRGGFVLTGHILQAVDPMIDVSAAGVRELLRVLGWPSPEEHTAALEDLVEAVERLDMLEAENNRLQQAADHVVGLSKVGYEIRKQRGRPPKEGLEA